MTNNEKELQILPCPLMDLRSSIHYDIGLEVAKSAILKSFEGNSLSISKLRDKYVKLWDIYWAKNHGKPAEKPTGPYWEGPRRSITTANKIIRFLNEYEIINPIQPFSYPLGNNIIEGTSCTVRKKSLSYKERNYFTVVFQEEVSIEEINPDIRAIIKWCYVETNYFGFLPNGILYVPLLKGAIRKVFIGNIKLAKSWITNAFSDSKRNIYPIAGAHCASCKSKKCQGVVDVRQNEDPRLRRLREISSRR